MSIGDLDDVRKSMGDLEDLRKEMKGLQEAFNSLKKEHSELRDELRLRKGTALPIDTLSIGKAKQASPLAFHTSHGPPGAHEGHASMANMEFSPQTQQVARVDDGDLLDGIWNTCGFNTGDKKGHHDKHHHDKHHHHHHDKHHHDDHHHDKHDNQAAIGDGASARSAETTPDPHSAMRKHQSLPAAPTATEPRGWIRTDHDKGTGPAAASSPLPVPLQAQNVEVGGSSSSAARGTASSRGLSPHDREGPMDGNARRLHLQLPPQFGLSQEQHPREQHRATDVAGHDMTLSLVGFETSARDSSAFSTLRPTLHVASPHGLEGQSGSAQRPTWRSPQAGQAWDKRMLPFPDLEDEENEFMSPDPSGASVAFAAATAPATFFWCTASWHALTASWHALNRPVDVKKESRRAGTLAPPAGTLSWHAATAPAAQQ